MQIFKGIVDIASMQIETNMSKYNKLFEVMLYSFIGFIPPFIFSHPQLLLGSVVNSALILGALYTRSKEIIPIIILPSIGVLLKSALFGELTKYIAYMIPFIWVGNTIIVLSMKYFFIKKRINYFLSLFLSSVFKSLFLFVSAYSLYSLNLVPPAFLIAFGVIQLITAVIGGIASYPVVKIREKIKKLNDE